MRGSELAIPLRYFFCCAADLDHAMGSANRSYEESKLPPIRRQRKSSDTKQRSFHLTDDVYAIVEREASAQGVSNSAWVSAVIQHVSQKVASQSVDPHSPERVAAAWQEHRRRTTPTLPDDAAPAASQPVKRLSKIALPDENVSEFTVERGKVRGKKLKSDHETGGVEGGAPKRRGRINRNEEIDL